MTDVAVLNARLGSPFRNLELLQRAITHRSAGPANNERLEFLGDALLNFVVGESLYHNMPSAEGVLSRMRANLVNRGTLADLARRWELDSFLILGKGEQGGARDSILSDAVEAIIGGIYLDRGFDVARRSIIDWYGDLLGIAINADKDPKTRLQEWVRAERASLPRYRVVSMTGPPHEPRYVVACAVDGIEKTTEGYGASRRGAEQEAARMMLEVIDSSDSVNDLQQ